MATYQKSMDELEELGVYVIGATIEDRDTAARMAEEEGITFPMAYGVTPESIGPLAPLWGEEKGYGPTVEPMEFLVRRGFVIGSMYASGPVGRMDVTQLIHFIKLREKSRRRALHSTAASREP